MASRSGISLGLRTARQSVGREVAIERERVRKAQSTHDCEREAIREVDRLVVVSEEQVMRYHMVVVDIRFDAHHGTRLEGSKLCDRVLFPDSLRHPIDVFDQRGPTKDEPDAVREGGPEEFERS